VSSDDVKMNLLSYVCTLSGSTFRAFGPATVKHLSVK